MKKILSAQEQLELDAKIQRIAQDNPDLTYEFIKNLLVARQEVVAGMLTPYKFDKKK